MNDEERPDWPDNATQEDMEEIERTEDRLNLLSRIDRAMGIARKKESPRITQWLEKSRQLLERPEFAVVSGWIALEIFGVKVIVRGLFLGMASPFEELAEWMRGRVFGGNGSIDKLRDLL